jgi:hypothetical protein
MRCSRDLPVRRLTTVVGVALAAEVLAGLALLSAVPRRALGVVLDVAGAVTAVAVVALLVGLPARRPGG